MLIFCQAKTGQTVPPLFFFPFSFFFVFFFFGSRKMGKRVSGKSKYPSFDACKSFPLARLPSCSPFLLLFLPCLGLARPSHDLSHMTFGKHYRSIRERKTTPAKTTVLGEPFAQGQSHDLHICLTVTFEIVSDT